MNRRESAARAGVEWELRLWAQGFYSVAGIDEVGRGAWAGPVVAAAVIFSCEPSRWEPLLGRVDDSKRLTPRRREGLIDDIQASALSIGIGFCDSSTIDRLGIVQATRMAMIGAVGNLVVSPDYLLVDYLTLPDLPYPQSGLPHGDATSLSIAAASIVAKVARDRWMVEREEEFPGYGFAQHKGYGTAAHRAALERQGQCRLHRRSFRPFFEGYDPGVSGSRLQGE